MQNFSFKKMHLKMLSVTWWPFYVGLKVLTHKQLEMVGYVLSAASTDALVLSTRSSVSTVLNKYSSYFISFTQKYNNYREQYKLEQLESLRSEDTLCRPMITHTIEQFILDPKPILLSSSYWIPSPYY